MAPLPLPLPYSFVRVGKQVRSRLQSYTTPAVLRHKTRT